LFEFNFLISVLLVQYGFIVRPCRLWDGVLTLEEIINKMRAIKSGGSSGANRNGRVNSLGVGCIDLSIFEQKHPSKQPVIFQSNINKSSITMDAFPGHISLRQYRISVPQYIFLILLFYSKISLFVHICQTTKNRLLFHYILWNILFRKK
jgi:hypothetical protein